MLCYTAIQMHTVGQTQLGKTCLVILAVAGLWVGYQRYTWDLGDEHLRRPLQHSLSEMPPSDCFAHVVYLRWGTMSTMLNFKSNELQVKEASQKLHAQRACTMHAVRF